ncbi:hypothetical protein [Streptomyces sp. NPDC001970]
MPPRTRAKIVAIAAGAAALVVALLPVSLTHTSDYGVVTVSCGGPALIVAFDQACGAVTPLYLIAAVVIAAAGAIAAVSLWKKDG